MSVLAKEQPGGLVASWRAPPDTVSLRARLVIGLIRLSTRMLAYTVRKSKTTGFDVESARRQVGAFENVIASMPAGAMFTPVESGPVAGDWIEMPKSKDDRVLLYVHGGSFILDRTKLHEALIARICRESGAKALIVDYRLAPEEPFPASIEDVKSAYRWLLSQGVDPERIGFVADSAGGAIALAALVSLRDEGARMPAAAAFLAPWVDLTLSGNSLFSNLKHDPMVNTLEGLSICIRLYLQGKPSGDTLASPLFADLHGLPPTIIQVGAPDVLRDDSTRLADRLKQAGCAVWCDVYPEMPHVWQRLGSLTPESRKALVAIGEFLREMMPAPPARSTEKH